MDGLQLLVAWVSTGLETAVSDCWGLFRSSKQEAEYKYTWLLIIPVLSNSVLPVSLPAHEVLSRQMSKEVITFKDFKQVHTCRVIHNVLVL